MIRTLIRARYASTATVLAGLVLLLAFGRHVTFEQSLTSFFPEGDPAVVDYQRACELFGNDNFVFIGYDDPGLLTPAGMDRVAELAEAVRPGRVPSVSRVESLATTPLFWRVDDELIRIERLPALLRPAAKRAARLLVANLGPAGEAMTVGGAIRRAGPEQLAELRGKIRAHPLLRGTLIDAKGTSTVVVVHLVGMAEQDVKRTVTELRRRADDFAARHRLGRPALVGPPVLLADGFLYIERDGQRLAIAGMALIGLVMLTVTQSLWWAVVPIAAGWLVWLAAETILASLGIKLSLSGGPLVAQIIVLTMPAVSHLASHFRDDLRTMRDRDQAARETLGAVSIPVLLVALTGMLGYGALLTSNVVPVRQFGAVLAICTLVAAVLTLLISPVAMRPPFRLEVPVRPGSIPHLQVGLNRLLAWVYRHPAAIALGAFAVVLPVATGMVRLRYESNYINAFKAESRVVRDYRFIESRLGGIGLISLVVPVDGAPDHAALGRFRGLDRAIVARGGAVAQVISPATVLDPEGRLAVLPGESAADALATKLDLIAAAPQGALMRTFWNPAAGRARVLVRVPEQQDAAAKEATFSGALAEARSPGRFGPAVYLTGLSYLLTQTTRGVMATSWSTFGWAAVTILAMLVLAFRGPVLAVLAILPSFLAVALVLGLMGWAGVKLDIATALVASVALGLSVDDTFHCLLNFRRKRALKDSFRASLFDSYAVSGPGVILSSLAVAAGFAVLWMSEFVPFSNFGMMVGIATLGSSLGNLVLLPACLTLGNRLRSRARPEPEPAPIEA